MRVGAVRRAFEQLTLSWKRASTGRERYQYEVSYTGSVDLLSKAALMTIADGWGG